ncbi:MAG: hypothetical protein IT365_09020 [Candidatus Hydrogenedentes bacterium]|nr:hypothetical protein [Candidatus Hydrogenedentota bacterium]
MGPSAKSKKPDAALAILFASRARAEVLRLFLVDPARAYYQRQIEAATGLPIRAVQRELERLQSINLLYRYAEGNRTYYQVDVLFPFFPELRAMVLKMASPVDRLRGMIAMDERVLLAILDEEQQRVLLVSPGAARPEFQVPEPFTLETLSREEFGAGLADGAPALIAYLTNGVDLLGRREDVIWRRIEAAGYSVKKGKGVA